MTTPLALVLAVFFGALGIAKLAAAPPMRAAAGHLGFTVDQFRGLGALELAGAAGVALGLWFPALGVAAAIALVLMMVGAVIAHLRNADPAVRVLAPVVTAALVGAYALLLMRG
jgi:DoxX-like family